MSSNRSVPVSVFNASSMPLQVVVNNGNPVSINGTGPAQNWTPQQPSSSPWSCEMGYPSPNSFGFGPNMVQMMAGGVSTNFQVNIPQSIPILSIQLYIFFSNAAWSWSLLNNGQLIGSGTGYFD